MHVADENYEKLKFIFLHFFPSSHAQATLASVENIIRLTYTLESSARIRELDDCTSDSTSDVHVSKAKL